MRRSTTKAAIIGLGLAALLALGGCSAVRIGYSQAPTLAWWWLDGYMDFDAEQAPKVKEALDQWFAWHRATQLPDYADLLAAAQVQVLQPATPQQVCRWSDDLRLRLAAAFAHGVPLAAELLPVLKPAQLAQLERRYRKSNRDFEDDFLQQEADERLKAAVKRTIDRAEMLYGRLDERQRQLVAAGVAASPFDPAAWFAERQAVQQETLQTLARLTAGPARADHASNLAGLQALAERVQRAPPGPYRSYQQRLTEYNCDFIAQLHNSTTTAQRQAARHKLKGWEDDLRALAVQRAPPRSDAVLWPQPGSMRIGSATGGSAQPASSASKALSPPASATPLAFKVVNG